jgi:hypothetical protein
MKKETVNQPIVPVFHNNLNVFLQKIEQQEDNNNGLKSITFGDDTYVAIFVYLKRESSDIIQQNNNINEALKSVYSN